MDFITPEAFLLIILLQENSQPPGEFDPNTKIASFIVSRIMVFLIKLIIYYYY